MTDESILRTAAWLVSLTAREREIIAKRFGEHLDNLFPGGGPHYEPLTLPPGTPFPEILTTTEVIRWMKTIKSSNPPAIKQLGRLWATIRL